MKRLLMMAASLAFAVLAAGTAVAHHAGTMYDHERVERVKGEVAQWRWANPHAFLQITVTDESGQQTLWSFESTSPNILIRAGWRRTTFAPGDEVEVFYNPLRDGAPGGSLTGVILKDGTELRARAGSGGSGSISDTLTEE